MTYPASHWKKTMALYIYKKNINNYLPKQDIINQPQRPLWWQYHSDPLNLEKNTLCSQPLVIKNHFLKNPPSPLGAWHHWRPSPKQPEVLGHHNGDSHNKCICLIFFLYILKNIILSKRHLAPGNLIMGDAKNKIPKTVVLHLNFV